ncbi:MULTISPECIES: hypothetical protein [unclassified Kribbella]|uniref:hypothetical protein n=1 Tax=unclassified Kribbella TaxID=2644121 RepID=UPI0033E2D77A
MVRGLVADAEGVGVMDGVDDVEVSAGAAVELVSVDEQAVSPSTAISSRAT